MASTVIRRTGCKKLNHSVFFARADMSMLDYCSRYFTDRLPVKDRIVFKISTSFVFMFLFCCCCFYGHLPPYPLSLLSVYPLSFSQSPFQFRWGEKQQLFLVQDGNLRALVTGRSLFRLPLSRTTFLLTSDSAVLELSQFKTSLKPFLFTSGNSELL